jgi:enterochelin esterase-like enzyme
MFAGSTNCVKLDHHTLTSEFLKRDVKVDCYIPPAGDYGPGPDLLLINDGQDLRTMGFEDIIGELFTEDRIRPVFCVGVHCSPDRKNEYGTARIRDYDGRGKNASKFNRFVFEELLPYLRTHYQIESFYRKSYAGFSLGGLTAMDIVWNHPHEFYVCGAFSGSFWWRDRDQEDPDFNEETDRIMHRQVREGAHYPWLKFFFEVGTKDETADRNKNGIIDSIDDTQSLIRELRNKGYKDEDILYLELADGKHDVRTWATAFPVFLEWAFGN